MQEKPQKTNLEILGDIDEKDKELAVNQINKYLFEHFDSLPERAQEKLKESEIPKSEKENFLIDFANKKTSEFFKKAGLPEYDIPKENFHIVPPKLFQEIVEEITGGRGFGGIVVNTKQGVFIDSGYIENNPLIFGAVIAHEIIHLKGIYGLEINKSGRQNLDRNDGYFFEDNKVITEYREGLSVHSARYSKNPQHSHFIGLHEAVATRQGKKLFQEMLGLEELKDEKKWLESKEALEIKKEMAERNSIPEDEIYWVDKEGDFRVFGYRHQTKTFEYILEEIYKEFKGEYKDKEEVFEEFLKAQFKRSSLLKIAKLVDKTFGKGSFRILGNMNIGQDNAITHLETMQNQRRLKLKGDNEKLKEEVNSGKKINPNY